MQDGCGIVGVIQAALCHELVQQAFDVVAVCFGAALPTDLTWVTSVHRRLRRVRDLGRYRRVWGFSVRVRH